MTARRPDAPAPDPTTDTTTEVDTPHGPARVHLRPGASPRGALVLGHGAGGGIQAPDLRAATAAAAALGLSVALVEQPYRVAGRRAPAPARQLDAAWTAVAARLRAAELSGLPLVVGGRSSGARVACRTASAVGAIGVLCLAFPLQPPGRADRPSRLPELDGAGVPTLVVQGERDAFGVPPEGPGRRVVVVAGDHALKKDVPAVRAAVTGWLSEVLGLAPPA
ncbi:alpha/beta family hydrolase [Georgenia sp. AZ-5]|uniref:alpha/beta hydrolase family protein n=1 Tax=Georgenia sp. AZ-5 TaxID=3367526 RepID=UPI0037542936